MPCRCQRVLAFGILVIQSTVSQAQLFIVPPGGGTNSASGGTVGLEWVASPDLVAGYQVAWGLLSGNCTNLLDAGPVTNTWLGGLQTNVTYFFSVAAYDWVGRVSDLANEVQYRVATPTPTTVWSTGLFKLRPLASFGGGNGAYPYAGLTQGADGNFYGTTMQGGANGYGTVYQLSASGTLQAIYSFNRSAGANPIAELIRGSDGNLFGSASGGGQSGGGTAFRVSASGTLDSVSLSAGSSPKGALVQDSADTFYGTTFTGGGQNLGAVYRATTAGVLTIVASFNGLNGSHPQGSLLKAANGNFYGTTYDGGTLGRGTIFQVDRSGVLSTVRSFAGDTDGANPGAGLFQAPDGTFYGTTTAGGPYGQGTVFQLRANGSLNVLHSFAGPDGANPSGGLILAADGLLYGTAASGGGTGDGTIFSVSTSGTFRLLWSFASGANGANPYGRLLQAGDGSFYGTTVGGGALDQGIAFRLNYVPSPYTRVTLQGRTGVNLTWSAVVGESYQPQWASELIGPWSNLGSAILASNATMSIVSPINADARRFFRVSVLP